MYFQISINFIKVRKWSSAQFAECKKLTGKKQWVYNTFGVLVCWFDDKEHGCIVCASGEVCAISFVSIRYLMPLMTDCSSLRNISQQIMFRYRCERLQRNCGGTPIEESTVTPKLAKVRPAFLIKNVISYRTPTLLHHIKLDAQHPYKVMLDQY